MIYRHRLADQHGETIIETRHLTEASRSADVHASESRIAEGKPNRGGQIPTTVETWETAS